MSPEATPPKVPQPIAPHGGTLVDRMLDGAERARWETEIPKLPKIHLTRRGISDVEMIAIGGFSPLVGFMTEADYEGVVAKMRLSNGLAWTVPVTLQVTEDEAAGVERGKPAVLVDEDGDPLAVLEVTDVYRPDKKREAQSVYRTTEEAHPGVAAVYGMGDVYVGGPIHVLRHPKDLPFGEHRLEPRQTREAFQHRGWKRIVAFQTRNPVHRAHEYIQKVALEIADGLLLHPLVGETKSDDIPAGVRMECYEVLLEKYYPLDRTVLSVLPANMRYAGPKEAIFHAIMRKNYGCTHFIVGRDHAGVGNYYGSFDAHHIFDEFKPGELGIEPILFDFVHYCKKCGGMASKKTCAHGPENHVHLSGTKVREMLLAGEAPPVEFTRPEIAAILVEAEKKNRS